MDVADNRVTINPTLTIITLEFKSYFLMPTYIKINKLLRLDL
jgi:hypothetical protein